MVIAALSSAARALVVHHERIQGTGTGKISKVMADFGVSPCFREAGHGIHGSNSEVHRLRRRVRFTAGEQVFFQDKQFKNDPKRCKQCKAKRVRGAQRVRPETRTTCSECGAETTVPFKPTQGRPVLCRTCFQKQGKPADAPAPSSAAQD